jgi:hypothetical protein
MGFEHTVPESAPANTILALTLGYRDRHPKRLGDLKYCRWKNNIKIVRTETVLYWLRLVSVDILLNLSLLDYLTFL